MKSYLGYSDVLPWLLLLLLLRWLYAVVISAYIWPCSSVKPHSPRSSAVQHQHTLHLLPLGSASLRHFAQTAPVSTASRRCLVITTAVTCRRLWRVMRLWVFRVVEKEAGLKWPRDLRANKHLLGPATSSWLAWKSLDGRTLDPLPGTRLLGQLGTNSYVGHMTIWELMSRSVTWTGRCCSCPITADTYYCIHYHWLGGGLA